MVYNVLKLKKKYINKSNREDHLCCGNIIRKCCYT